MKFKTTKRSLLVSGLVLLLCVSMLIGSTFAWFSDSVTSKNNIIKSGNLDIALEYSMDGGTTWEVVEENTKLFTEESLWEPGYTEVVYLKLVNKGTLALNYQVGINIEKEETGINVAGETFKLSDYIMYGVVKDQNTAFADRAAAVAAVSADSRKMNEGYVDGGSLLAQTGTEAYMAMVVYMPETVGNEANHNGEDVPEITFGVNVLATQKTFEEDSFGPDYDALAQGGYVTEAAPAAGDFAEYTVRSNDGTKVATMLVRSDSVEDLDAPISISIVPTGLDSSITVAADQSASTYDISVTNLKEGNTEPIKVNLQIGTGLSGVKIYHESTLIDSSYDPLTGYVIFETTSFSPYTVVFDAEYEAGTEGNSPADLPKATVENSPAYENVDLEWESYGAWSPTEGLDSQLEAAYTFTCADVEGAATSPYADWYCDFYVMLNQDLGENEIFLGGNYGDFGWVGFHNGVVTLAANEEIPLLGSVTTNPWTYEAVAENVGTFICGVGDVDDALSGATFTVMLRLTNPDNEAEFYNVATINYTFEQ